MRCGQHGCECNTCPECHETYFGCKCGLLEATRVFLERIALADGPFLSEARALLTEWSNLDGR